MANGYSNKFIRIYYITDKAIAIIKPILGKSIY